MGHDRNMARIFLSSCSKVTTHSCDILLSNFSLTDFQLGVPGVPELSASVALGTALIVIDVSSEFEDNFSGVTDKDSIHN